MDKVVDFSQPVAAYHEDGRVYAARIIENICPPWARAVVQVNGFFSPETYVRENGKLDCAPGWWLRNIIPAKPSTPSNVELTQRMEIPQAMAQRMAAHLRECDQVHGIRPRDATAKRLYDEMKSIVSDLPKPVDPIDPDLVHARHIVAAEYERGNMPGLARRALAGEMDGRMRVRAAQSAVKFGRTLAAGGTAHE